MGWGGWGGGVERGEWRVDIGHLSSFHLQLAGRLLQDCGNPASRKLSFATVVCSLDTPHDGGDTSNSGIQELIRHWQQVFRYVTE